MSEQKPVTCKQGDDLNSANSGNWLVYIIRCDDGSLYTGITNNLDRRYKQHVNKQGAKYFRGRCPVEVVYLEQGHSRGSALQREIKLKALRQKEKLSLIASFPQS